LLAVNGKYHVWVRAHHGPCHDASNVKVRLASAAPSTLNTQVDWVWITPDFQGPELYPDGVTIPASAADQWIGPFDVQIGPTLEAFVYNPQPTESSIALRLSSPDMTKSYQFTLPYDAAIEAAWAGTPNVATVHFGDTLVVVVRAREVSLPGVLLPGFAKKRVVLSLPEEEPGTEVTVHLMETVNGTQFGGMTLHYEVPEIVIPK
jgi:hypothetical protein